MEALILIALVIIIFLLFSIKSRQTETTVRLYEQYDSLKNELRHLQETTKKNVAEPPAATDETVVQWRPTIPANITSPQVTEPVVENIPEPVALVLEPQITEEGTSQQIESPVVPTSEYVSPTPAESWSQKWLLNNPDLEKFIGENLINKIGIAILVLGIAFFVKYAIDQNWINEVGRVCIGIGCGVILTGLAHYLRNSYRSFSSVLAGGGIAVFYFTVAFAFHEYGLFSQPAAFAMMLVITVFAVLLSLLYDKLELATIATIGGFITPFLVTTGSGNYVVLFIYLAILNAGMLALAYFKKWPLINIISFFFTIIIYGGWLVQNAFIKDDFAAYRNGLLFAVLFYLLFLSMTVVYNIRKQQSFKALDFSLLILLTFSFYAAGMTNLHFWNNGAYQGLFTIVLGATNFLLAGYFYKTEKGDKNLLYLLIGLTLTFVSLAAPVQLHGHTITLFWSAEFVLIYWLHQRSKIEIFKYSSAIIMIMMLFSLLIDWQKANSVGSDHLTVIYNNLQGLVTNIVAAIAFAIYAVLVKKEPGKNSFVLGIKNSVITAAIISMAAGILFLTCIFGVNLYFYENGSAVIANGWHQLITYLFITAMLLLVSRYELPIKLTIRFLLIAFGIGTYLLSIPTAIDLRNGVLQHQYPIVHLWVHWLSVIVLAYLIYQAIALFRKRRDYFLKTANLFTWLVNIVWITFFSVECMHLYVWLTNVFQDIFIATQQYAKAGVTIVWAVCSFAIMWLGMKYKFKTLRIISLTLFSMALVKLFLFDIRNITAGGKIAAFILLGILLLIISFMYQKLKKIIIDDTVQ